MAAISQKTFSSAFMNENVWITIKISLKCVPKGSIKKYSIIRSDNGLAPTRRQDIIWNNDDYFRDTYMNHSTSMS